MRGRLEFINREIDRVTKAIKTTEVESAKYTNLVNSLEKLLQMKARIEEELEELKMLGFEEEDDE